MITIKEITNQNELEEIFRLRWKVLREPWGKPRGTEIDELENQAIHISAFYKDKIVGVCRVHLNSPSEAQIRFMAILPDYQKLHIGKQLMEYAEKVAKRLNAKYIILNAREPVIDFYKKCGFSVEEKTFLLWGEIQHYLMRKEISFTEN